MLIVNDGHEWAGIESHLKGLIIELQKNNRFDISILLFSNGEFSNWGRKQNLKVNVIEKRNYIVNMINVINYFKRNRFNIIHTHSNIAFYICLILPFLRKTFWINTQHGKNETKNSTLKEAISRTIITFFSRFYGRHITIAVSIDLAKWVKEYKKIKNDKIRVIRNGIELDDAYILEGNKSKTIKLREINRLDSNDFVICIIGRLVPVKGHIILFKAIKKLYDKDEKLKNYVKIIVIGDGPLENELKKFCKDNNIDMNVIFLGYKQNAREYISISDAVVIPSIHEGIPYTLLEAMLAKKIIIASEVGGLKEVLNNKIDALLFKANDHQQLLSNIQYVIENKSECSILSKNANKSLKKNFTSKKMAGITIKLYCSCLSQPNNGGGPQKLDNVLS